MLETELELAKLGVPVKTRHNEVAPNQYEIAPIFENSNVGSDHQQLTMQVMQNVARRYGLVCLLHEKPFAGVNGSGKHNNWSMGTDTGDEPARARRHAAREPAVPVLLRRGDPGRQRPPGAAARVDRLARPGPPPRRQRGAAGDHLDLPRRGAREGVRGDRGGQGAALQARLVPRPRHARAAAAAAARRRPQPHRARSRSPATSSSSARSAPASRRRCPNTVLNTIVAEAIDDLADKLEERAERARRNLEKAVAKVVKESYGANKRIVFDGDNYSPEWHAEAEKRGLYNLRSTPDALPWLVDKGTIALFKKYKVLSKRELESRHEVFLEQYATKINIEAETAASIARTQILPAAVRHLNELSAAGLDELIGEVEPLIKELHFAILALEDVNLKENQDDKTAVKWAAYMHDRGDSGDGRRARGRRPAGGDRRRRPVAAAEVLGDAVHQVARDP